jgi:putative effector of murein hydrolase LrgA (UPF0299 family)
MKLGWERLHGTVCCCLLFLPFTLKVAEGSGLLKGDYVSVFGVLRFSLFMSWTIPTRLCLCLPD